MATTGMILLTIAPGNERLIWSHYHQPWGDIPRYQLLAVVNLLENWLLHWCGCCCTNIHGQIWYISYIIVSHIKLLKLRNSVPECSDASEIRLSLMMSDLLKEPNSCLDTKTDIHSSHTSTMMPVVISYSCYSIFLPAFNGLCKAIEVEDQPNRVLPVNKHYFITKSQGYFVQMSIVRMVFYLQFQKCKVELPKPLLMKHLFTLLKSSDHVCPKGNFIWAWLCSTDFCQQTMHFYSWSHFNKHFDVQIKSETTVLCSVYCNFFVWQH